MIASETYVEQTMAISTDNMVFAKPLGITWELETFNRRSFSSDLQKADPAKLSNYRPASLLSYLGRRM